MKTYVANLIPRLQQFSQTLDRKEILIDQPWVHLDEQLNKTQYIFRRDGSLIMSLNGNVVTGKWEYISAARSLLLDAGDVKLLLNHGFVDAGILVLKKDGCQHEPWVLVNQRIVPDLDPERYLRGLMVRKLNLKAVKMEQGSVFEFPDPNEQGLVVGTRVNFFDTGVPDGIYNIRGSIRCYVVQNNKVVSIYSRVILKTDRGTLEVRRSTIDDRLQGAGAYQNGAPASNGQYIITGGNDLKSIYVEAGRVSDVKKKFTFAPLIVCALIAVAVLCLYWFNRQPTKDEVQVQSSPLATQSLSDGAKGSTIAEVTYRDNDARIEIRRFLDVENAGNYTELSSFFSGRVVRYFDKTQMTPEEVVNKIIRYRTEVISSSHTQYDANAMWVTHEGDSYIVRFPLTVKSTLRRNGVSYTYETDNEIRLDRDLKIFYMSGKVTRKTADSGSGLDSSYHNEENQ